MHQPLHHSVMSVNKQLCWPKSTLQFLTELGGVNSLKYLQLSGMPLQHYACACVGLCVWVCGWVDCVCIFLCLGVCMSMLEEGLNGYDDKATVQATGR